jgi:hypothetical protein
MRQGMRLPSASLAISALALFVALGGTVYAAAKLDGKAIKMKSLPGNRLKVHSVAANRLKPGALRAATAGGPGNLIVGSEIDLLSLGQVPEAAHSETAGYAQTAGEAQTALNAVNAVNAQTVNGHSAGCQAGTQEFAGACWQLSYSEVALSAPAAASSCAAQGGTLPEALQLAAFSQQPGVALASGDEWAEDIPVVTGPGIYAVITVSASGEVATAASTSGHKFRCVIPLVT